MEKEILNRITNYYLGSRDFNGISLNSLIEETEISEEQVVEFVGNLIQENRIGLISQKQEMNPHIIRVGFVSIEEQINSLSDKDCHHTCFYPTKQELLKVVDTSQYLQYPYKLLMALGDPQLNLRHFDLSILEFYRNDPRYYYTANDIGGTLSVRDEFYKSSKMKETDQVLIQSFGFSYDENRQRAICTFICDLAKLSPEHQMIWKAKELNSKYNAHPAFYNSQVYNVRPKGVTILTAVIREIYTINQITQIIWNDRLFIEDFGEYGERTPKKLSLLIRPTLEEYNNFIILLDKILSENINLKFFDGIVDKEYDEIRKSDNKIIVRKKGSISILDEWIRSICKFTNDTGWKISIKALKEVRKQRQNPAHKIEEDKFDQKYFQLQKQIIDQVWNCLNFLRNVLQSHPKCDSDKLDIPEWQKKNFIYSI